MNDVEQIYKENKLLVRAMDWPLLKRENGEFLYDCTIWSNEFYLLSNRNLSSSSSTLIIPNVGISTYKSIGFLINSDLANCFHIATSDSGSRGDIVKGTFGANNPDFDKIEDLANYIKENNATRMNEVNIVTTIDSVVGLEEKIISSLKTKKIFYWPDEYDEAVYESMDNILINHYKKNI